MSCSGFFVLVVSVTKLSPRAVPAIIAAGAIGTACGLPILSAFFPNNILQSLEWDAYDWRLRRATLTPTAVATNLGTIYLDEESIGFLSNTLRVNWPYPRQVHGRIVRELTRQGAKAVAFDILFTGLRPMDAPVPAANNGLEESDDFFVRQLQTASNVFIAEGEKAEPAPIFAAAAAGVGHIITPRDADGIIRRVPPVILDPLGQPRWQLGVLLAAKDLGLDLARADISQQRIVFPKTAGGELVVPLDAHGNMLIDWNLTTKDSRLMQANFGIIAGFDLARELEGDAGYENLLAEYVKQGQPDFASKHPFSGKLFVVGSIAEGSNVTDVGPTPLSEHTPLVATHLNVANTIIMGRFIKPLGMTGEIILLSLLGAFASLLAWRTPVVHGALWLVGAGVAITLLSLQGFAHYRLWIPIVNPIVGGLLIPFVSLVSYRVIFGEKEQRRIKQVFKRVVSPNVVNELLAAERLSLGGARRSITVFFADVRGFTEMTDSSHAKAEQHVKDHHLMGDEAEAYFDSNARDVLATVNLYLGTIADIIKKHDGTLDKYIGDCVMAFWGAPIADEDHAAQCVRAAIEAQRAIHTLNINRAAENERRKTAASPGEAVELLPLLSLGTGINTGIATVGLMGSEEHTFNYTVFGREVNLASRLEGFSGRGRIIIGENTFAELKRHAPELAATCSKQAPHSFKGFREEMITYEVPWKDSLGTTT